jgi:hypothetical protein
MPTIDGPPVQGLERSVKLGEREYSCFVYGRRANQTTKLGIPLHGVAIDRNLALADSSIREFEPGEVPDSGRKVVDLTSKTQGSQSVLGQVGETIYRFVTHEQLVRMEKKLEAQKQDWDLIPSDRFPIFWNSIKRFRERRARWMDNRQRKGFDYPDRFLRHSRGSI